VHNAANQVSHLGFNVDVSHRPNYVNFITFFSFTSAIISLLFYFRFIHKSQHDIRTTLLWTHSVFFFLFFSPVHAVFHNFLVLHVDSSVFSVFNPSVFLG
jgi:hypothetical protein